MYTVFIYQRNGRVRRVTSGDDYRALVDAMHVYNWTRNPGTQRRCLVNSDLWAHTRSLPHETVIRAANIYAGER